MANIKPGYYKIYGTEQYEWNPISRSMIEDRSLWPKKIWALRLETPGLQPWKFTKSGDGFILESRGAPTGQDEGDVVAILNPRWNDYIEWVIDQPQDVAFFKIRTKDRKLFWTISEENGFAGRQIVLRKEGEGFQNFRLVRVDEDDFEAEEHGYNHGSGYRGRHRPGEEVDSEYDNHFSYGKRQKKFCS
ncbi:hypothetical protein TWF730_008288 [Orbilia blumenaviensis]|uniref:Uncharacterized protein n=1 Tax=Orbilia blumenaviensis TaxID=1796055 RepID=A0AAV9V8P1_9PEZI